MTLKERLDAVWNDNKIACATHLVAWHQIIIGHKIIIGYSVWTELGLWYTKGKLLGPKKSNIRGKGFSFLNKYYGLAHTEHIRKLKKRANLRMWASR